MVHLLGIGKSEVERLRNIRYEYVIMVMEGRKSKPKEFRVYRRRRDAERFINGFPRYRMDRREIK